MNFPKVAPYGTWSSPVTTDLIVAGTIGLSTVAVDGEDIYWLEGRPQEQGRNVLVSQHQGEVTPMPFNVRTRVHEYGGGAFLVADDQIYFVNLADQRIYTQPKNQNPIPLTPESSRRYADLILDGDRQRLIAVCENHHPGRQEPENTLVTIDLKSGVVEDLIKGADFYSSPRLSPDGHQLAWLSWNHPYMPWDSTQLWVSKFNPDGSLGESQLIAGGENESINQPEWSPDGQLYFVSDRQNWWNLYRLTKSGEIESVYPLEAEFTYPHWIFGISLYGFVNEQEIITAYTQNGGWYLAHLNTKTRVLSPFELPYTNILSVKVWADQVLLIAASPTQPTAVIKFNWRQQTTEILRQSSEVTLDKGYLTIPEAITFPTTEGVNAHAWYYPPTNQDYSGPAHSLPPLIVKSHGGPSAPATAGFSLKIQYWTSRGFAVLDVNYGGSTGYGREYRQRLEGKWGIVDVDDCVNAAKYLVSQGKVDGERLAITGGSAGGYTTLAALTFKDTFKAGASYYGVSDLEALAKDTHKFESRYLDRLVGPYPAAISIYKERSPIHHTQLLNCPVIFFQGLEDKVVPPNQAEKMVEALQAKGIPVTYVPFPDEQHGFRRAENIKTALERELSFYAEVFQLN